MSAAAGGASGREPLLLLHGLGGTRSVWEPVIPLLEGDREVHAIDMPGFGDAPPLPPKIEPTAANLARAVHEECARNGVERPHVAGNSLGGWVALEMGRFGWATSVTTLSPAGLWSRPLGEPARGGARMLLRGSPWRVPFSRWPSSSRRRATRPSSRSPPTRSGSRPRRRERSSSAGSTARDTTPPTERCAATSSTPPATPKTCR